jgi:DNA-binding MarR family transcriptional regulator
MEATPQSSAQYPDLLGLASASMREMVEQLVAWTDVQTSRSVPRATHQLAILIRSEAIRLIRLGTPRESSDAATALSRVVIGHRARHLEETDPEALRIVSASFSVLGAAVAPSSTGAELNVLRSWNGLAQRVVELLHDQPPHEMERAELRERLGIDDQSHLSHILRDLEASGLVVRTRTRGRNVTVHLGPVAREPRVRDLLVAGKQIDSELASRIKEAFAHIADSTRLGDPASEAETVARELGLEAPLREIHRFRERVQGVRVQVEDLVASNDAIVACLRFRGVRWGDFERPVPVDVRQVWLVCARDERVSPALRSPTIDELLRWGPTAPEPESVTWRSYEATVTDRVTGVYITGHNAFKPISRDVLDAPGNLFTVGTSLGGGLFAERECAQQTMSELEATNLTPA